jgi:hypothetical protein
LNSQFLDTLLLTTEVDTRYFTGFLTQFFQSPTRPWFLVVPKTGKPVAGVPAIGATARNFGDLTLAAIIDITAARLALVVGMNKHARQPPGQAAVAGWGGWDYNGNLCIPPSTWITSPVI